MYKKSSVKAVGSYQDFYLLEDYHLWIRMLMNGYKGYNLEDILLNMRAGNNMYKRRAGFKYVLSQIRLFKYMKENKYISNVQYIENCIIRTLSTIVPTWFRKICYKKFLRS